jgi:hypothetical protein
MEDYTERVYAHLVTFFDRLEEFHVIQRPFRDYPDLTICHFPHETFASSHLTSLSIKASTWSDSLCLLDGRLKQLRTFHVVVDSMKTDSSISHNSVGPLT